MANKLSPPIIFDNLPAFYSDNKNECHIQIPFWMNSIVGFSDISKIAVQIKNISSNRIIYSDAINFTGNLNTSRQEVNFIVDNQYFTISNFYKIQIAYVNVNNEIGFYSKAGVAKYTYMPTAYIDELEDTSRSILLHRKHYTGIYQNNDISEKLYSYRFQLIEIDNNNLNETILDDTDEILYYNNSSDNQKESGLGQVSVGYDCYNSLDDSKTYQLKFSVKSIHGLESFQTYKVVEKMIYWQWFDGELVAENNSSKGSISIFIENNTENKLLNGTFVLSRSSSEDNYSKWYDLQTYSWVEHYKRNKILLFEDKTVEQGIYYKYALQLINMDSPAKLRTERSISNIVYADFEDCFLFDGDFQLKLCFNTKISSFKTTLLEQKIDTIGSKFPVFLRNGKVAYKEFPIAGLISYLMDNDNDFIADLNIGLEKDERTWRNNGRWVDPKEPEPFSRTTQLTDYNIAAERRFKLKVLDWLNNGKPKLFRSPTEGIYLIRLMNTSLTPEEALGRMLHNFSTTAYEIDEHDPATLIKYNIIRPEDIIYHSYLVGETVTVMPEDIIMNESQVKTKNFFEGKEIIGFDIDSTLSFLNIQLTDSSGYSTNINMVDQHYAIQPSEGYKFISCQLSNKNQGNIFIDPIAAATGPVVTVTYYYWQTPIKSWFNCIYDLYYKTMIGQQFIGAHKIQEEIKQNYFISPGNIISIGARYRPLIKIGNRTELQNYIIKSANLAFDLRYFLYGLKEEEKNTLWKYKRLQTTDESNDLKQMNVIQNDTNLYYFDMKMYTANERERFLNILFPSSLKYDWRTQPIQALNEKIQMNEDEAKKLAQELNNIAKTINEKNKNIKETIKEFLSDNYFDLQKWAKNEGCEDELVFIYNPQEPFVLYLSERVYFHLLDNETRINYIESGAWRTQAIKGIFKCYDNTFIFGKHPNNGNKDIIDPWISVQSIGLAQDPNIEQAPPILPAYQGFTASENNPVYELYPNELEQGSRSFKGIKELDYLQAINKHYIAYQGSPELSSQNLVLESSMGIVVDISYDCIEILFNMLNFVHNGINMRDVSKSDHLFQSIKNYLNITNAAEKEDIRLYQNCLPGYYFKDKFKWYTERTVGINKKINEYSDLIQEYVKANNLIDINNKIWSSILDRGRGQ